MAILDDNHDELDVEMEDCKTQEMEEKIMNIDDNEEGDRVDEEELEELEEILASEEVEEGRKTKPVQHVLTKVCPLNVPSVKAAS